MKWIDNDRITIFLSEKSDGDMRFSNNTKSPKEKLQNYLLNRRNKKNRKAFFEKEKIDPARTTAVQPVHGVSVKLVTENDLGEGALHPETTPEVDALVTNLPNATLIVMGADCIPVFFLDEERHTISIAHSGWKGTQLNIASEVVQKMKTQFNINPEDLKVWLGPGLKECHFEVKEDVAQYFRQYPDTIEEREGKNFLNLPQIIKQQLIKEGVRIKNISEHPDCTYCEEKKWFSYRRDKPRVPQTMAFAIRLKS